MQVGMDLGAGSERGVCVQPENAVGREQEQRGEPSGAAAAQPDAPRWERLVRQVADGEDEPLCR
jgi:hypothetical protein